MSIGIRLQDAQGQTLAQRADTAKSLGCGCVHLALNKVMGSEYTDPTLLTPGLAAYIRKQIAPMDLAALGCFLNLAHPYGSTAQEIQNKYIAHLRFARWAGAPLVVTETGNPNTDYHYDPVASHSEEALDVFIHRLAPVAKAAEKLGMVIAIKPVWRHIVYDGQRARRVLDAIDSPNLQVALDPVNLLAKENMDRKDQVMDEALDLLMPDIAMLHIKDYLVEGVPRAVAAGEGLMDFRHIFERLAPKKPFIHIALENTTAENAARALQHVRTQWQEAGGQQVDA